MAVHAVMSVKGVPGSSPSLKDGIDILSFSFSSSNQALLSNGGSGSDFRAGKASLGEVNILKAVDKTSPVLFQNCVTGTFVDSIDITYLQGLGSSGGQKDYYKVHLEKVLITGFQNAGSSENPTESISFAFGKIKVSFNPEGSDGSQQGYIDKGFDVLALMAW